MSRIVLSSLLILLSGNTIVAEAHHYDKKETVVIENTKDAHLSEEKRSLKALCCQFTRSYVRESVALIATGAVYCLAQGKSDQLPTSIVAGCIGFSIGHILKKTTKLIMYLNNIPKE